jgi:hypothetical protein
MDADCARRPLTGALSARLPPAAAAAAAAAADADGYGEVGAGFEREDDAVVLATLLQVREYHLTPHNSHITPHTSHLTPHTSHLTPNTLHLTPYTLHFTAYRSAGFTIAFFATSGVGQKEERACGGSGEAPSTCGVFKTCEREVAVVRMMAALKLAIKAYRCNCISRFQINIQKTKSRRQTC